MFDTFIIKKTPSQYYIDCDNNKKSQLAKHLKLHKVRRKLVIEVIPDCKIGAVFDTEYPLEELKDSSGEYYKDSRWSSRLEENGEQHWYNVKSFNRTSKIKKWCKQDLFTKKS